MPTSESLSQDSLENTVVSYEDILEFFPYDEPRENQVEGMVTAAKAASEEGYFVLEGECGTGKTLLSLAPFLALVNSPKSKFERIAVATSVKQQLKAFQDELKRINEYRSSPVSALTLVGKGDVCPYVETETFTDKEVYRECERLRDNTRRLADDGDSAQAYRDLFTSAGDTTQRYTDSGIFEYAFSSDLPQTSDTEYCPYYAQYLTDVIEGGEDVGPTDIAPRSLLDGVMTQSDILHKVSEYGSCPHAVMRDLIPEVDVVIGNYYHLFEPLTVKRMTGEIIDDNTLVIIDEAHNLVPQVREQLSTEVTTNTIQNAQGEMTDLKLLMEIDASTVAKASNTAPSDLGDELSESETEQITRVQNHIRNNESIATNVGEFVEAASEVQSMVSKLEASERKELKELASKWVSVLDDLEDVVDKLTQEVLEENFGSNWMDVSDEQKNVSMSLRDDPSEPSQDRITQWASLIPDGTKVLQSGEFVGQFISDMYQKLIDTVFDERSGFDSSFETVGYVMQRWMDCDHTQYYRELELSERGYTTDSYYLGWQNEFTASLKLNNCIPRDEISKVLQRFGGGMLMSATLAPLDVFADEVGVTELEDEYDRPVYTDQFGLHFPEENRDTFIVPSETFKYQNKKQPFNSYGEPTSNPVRDTYWNICKDVVTETDGNVLLAMPSYAEAEWVGKLLKKDADVSVAPTDILIDQSSSSAVTENMKNKFFESGNKVLVTGARGTLVEGVDYKGDKLSAAVVCGVPIENTASNLSSAIQAAYEETFGEDNGFNYAFVVPAVRKSRQSIGRVIRTDDDKGIRVLADKRYSPEHNLWDSVSDFLPQELFDECDVVEPENVQSKTNTFWKYQQKYN